MRQTRRGKRHTKFNQKSGGPITEALTPIDEGVKGRDEQVQPPVKCGRGRPKKTVTVTARVPPARKRRKSEDSESDLPEVFDANKQKIVCDCGGDHSYGPYPPTFFLPLQELDELGVPLPYANAENQRKDFIWLPHLQLTQRELHTLEGGLLFNAFHISAAMYLLRRKAHELQKLMGGLDYQQRLQENMLENSFMTGEVAIQIVHIPDHWQLLVRRGRRIHFYCSLGYKITDEILRLLGHLMGRKQGDILEIHHEQCQKQLGVDYGIHAIAMAVAVVYDQDPGKASFDPDMLRPYLATCYQNHNITVFPAPPRNVQLERTRASRTNMTAVPVPRLWHKKKYVKKN